jgi:hypothetical protein
MVFLSTLAVPGLSLPFCIGILLFCSLQNSFPGFLPVPLSSITVPEAHILEAMCVALRALFLRSACWRSHASGAVSVDVTSPAPPPWPPSQ